MDDPLIDLMHECVVKLSLPGKNGTGFFVTPDLILTCAHVVGDIMKPEYFKGEINVRWKDKKDFAIARVIPEKWLSDPDIALLSYSSECEEVPPCVLLGTRCETKHDLATFGYPHKDFPNGYPATFECTGYTGDDPPLVRLKLDTIQSGMSGSPVLNIETKRVCAMVKFTVDQHGLRGGGGVPTETILKHFVELIERQKQFHQKDGRWYARAGIKAPSELSETVSDKIIGKLGERRLETLRDSVSRTLEEKKGINFRSAANIVSTLLEMETTDTLPLIFMAREQAIADLEKKGAGDDIIQYVRSGTLDILGWLVLLAFNVAWFSENRNSLYPERFPGAIELPVKTDTGIEIIHAAIEERCARFNLSTDGILFGDDRMPSVGHEFLEGGIRTHLKKNAVEF